MPEPAELLAGRVARGDDAAAEELVEAMRPLVSSMATRFQGRVPRSDLEQAGVVGLLRAAATFDAERGTPFGGYAAPFVMGEMLACVRQLAAVERRLELGSRLHRLDPRSRAVLVLRFGIELSQREIAERLGISQMHVSRLLRAAMADIAEEGEDDAPSR